MARPTLLFGGTGSERRVSVASAQGVSRELPDAELWFIDPVGAVVVCSRERLAAHARPFEMDFDPPPLRRWGSLREALAAAGPQLELLLCLHGSDGEDGSLQRQLEAAGVAYTGSDAEASARAFDKQVAKQICAAAGAAVAPGLVLPAGPADQIARAVHELWKAHGALALKPLASGSSVGLHLVRRREDLEAALAQIVQSGEPYLAEKIVEGTELTVGVVDWPDGARSLPVSEIRVDPGRSFDYLGKYLGRGTAEITPAEIAPAHTAAAQALALLAHRALGCFGYSRTDMILDGGGQPVFLETNTLPGLTAASFIPQQLRAAGIPFADFLNAQLALARARAKARRGRPE